MNSTKNLFKKYFISTKNLNFQELNEIFSTSLFMKKNKNIHNYNNKILVNAFFEPSTRTSLSFESAMYRLGGKVITFNKDVSSLKKGESIYDTLKTLENYGDIMAIRHPDKNLIDDITNSDFLKIPIINGGNGAGEHPTQALLDLFTIYEKYDYDFNNIKKLKILFIGDIIDSRTVHSLINLLHLFPEINIHILPYNSKTTASNELLISISQIHNQDINSIIINENKIKWNEYDVFYCTRYQSERKFFYDQIDDNSENNEINQKIIINKNNIKKMKDDAMIMHPLPRNNEINPEVDNDKRIYYFRQMENGVYIRMAIISKLLE